MERKQYLAELYHRKVLSKYLPNLGEPHDGLSEDHALLSLRLSRNGERSDEGCLAEVVAPRSAADVR